MKYFSREPSQMGESQGQKKGLMGVPKLTISWKLKTSQDWLPGAKRMFVMVIPTTKALRSWGSSFCVERNKCGG